VEAIPAGRDDGTASQVDVRASTSSGRVRERNEDAFAVVHDPGLLVVADGLGGHPAGDRASELAVSELVRRTGRSDLADGAGLQRLGSLVQDAHQRLREAARDPELEGMGTTLVAAHVDEQARTVTIVHVGDSRAYLVGPATARRLTHDHVIVVGGRRTLTQALGIGEVQPEVIEVPVSPGDVLLLCTDGLTDMVAEDEIFEVVRRHAPDLDAVHDELVAWALAAGGHDNITLVLALAP
jgi:PPM family protein phosphatase